MTTDKDQPETIIAQPVERRQDWAASSTAMDQVMRDALTGGTGIYRIDPTGILAGSSGGATKAWSGELPAPFFYYRSHVDGTVEWGEDCVCQDDVYTGECDDEFCEIVGGKAYSEAQMRSSVGAALEAAAQAGEAEKVKVNKSDVNSGEWSAYNDGIDNAVAAIRALNKLAPAGGDKDDLIGRLRRQVDDLQGQLFDLQGAGAAREGAQQAPSRMENVLRAAMNRAFSFGQTYWQQADSESVAQHKKSAETALQFQQLLESTCGALSGEAQVAAPEAQGPLSLSEYNARLAIGGAIQYGRENRNPPPSTDHWLYEYWNIGRQLATLGATGWDNVTPISAPGMPPQSAPTEPISAPQSAVAVPQPVLMAYVATDLDGHYDVGTTIEQAKKRAGPGCDTIFPLHDISPAFIEFEGKVVESSAGEAAAPTDAERALLTKREALTLHATYDWIVQQGAHSVARQVEPILGKLAALKYLDGAPGCEYVGTEGSRDE